MNRTTVPVSLAAAALFLLGSCTTSTAGNPDPLNAELDRLLADFVADSETLNLPGLQLSFAANLNALGTSEQLQQQEHLLRRYLQKLEAFEHTSMDICRKIDVSIATAQAYHGVQRATLAQRFLPNVKHVDDASRLSDLPLAREWYQYFLNRWNGADVDIDHIFAFGEQQLARSVTQYDSIQRQLGFAGDDDGLAKHLANYTQRLDGGQPTLELFKRRQTQVWKNLPRLFSATPNMTRARIARSDRGESFPVPGYYEPATDGGTFFYNLVADGFEVRQADWLYLHEGTPGHHFQFSSAARETHCQSRLPVAMQSAFSEGWAAYVETLGKELGLYATPEAALAAIEWDMVRSVRVVLDVALNAYDWSEEQALEYWHAHVRGQRDIAQREIDRMMRWPAQVVTYKYGADVFEQTRRRFVKENDTNELRQFHDTTMIFGPMPLATYQRLFADMADEIR